MYVIHPIIQDYNYTILYMYVIHPPNHSGLYTVLLCLRDWFCEKQSIGKDEMLAYKQLLFGQLYRINLQLIFGNSNV